MHIIFISTEFLSEPSHGGLAHYLNRVVRYLSSQGHEVAVITPSDQESVLRHNGAVTVHRLRQSKFSRVVGRLPLVGLFRGVTGCIDYSIRACLRARRISMRKRVDLVQVASIHGCGLFALLFPVAPTVVRVSSYRPLCNKFHRIPLSADVRMIENLESLQLRIARYIFCPSKMLAHLLARKTGRQDIRQIASTIYVEIDESKFDWSVVAQKLEKRVYLLFFGRLQLHKGIAVLTEALTSVLPKHPWLNVVFVGENGSTVVAEDMRLYIRSRLTAYAERLVFVDHLDHRTLYPVIKKAKLVVLPSLIENLPNACLEAMTLGRPVLGTRGTSFEEIIDDGTNGFLCRPGDADDLAKTLNRALRHPNLEGIGKCAQEKAAAFAPEKTVGKLLDFYEGVIAQQTQARKA